LFITIGGCIGYWQGDIKLLLDDIGELKPHFFAGVPRVFERIYGGIQQKVRTYGQPVLLP
jgi:long-chain acyl-CoA synthetase